MQQIIIGLSGKAGTGKSTVSLELQRRFGFTRLAFADPIKGMLRTFLLTYGYDAAMVERYIDGDLKEVACPGLGGSTSRYVQQTLGTEWGRDRVHPAIWTNHLTHRMSMLGTDKKERIVIDDVRMDNEAEAIFNFATHGWHSHGTTSFLYNIDPVGDAKRHPPRHASERGINRAYLTASICHDFTMEGLEKELQAKVIGPLGLTVKGPWT